MAASSSGPAINRHLPMANKPKYFNDQEFSGQQSGLFDEDHLYLRCRFIDVTAEGADLSDSVFIECEFRNVDWYGCFGFRARFISCTLKQCDLRANFDEAWFVECAFDACDYGPNSLGGKTEWEHGCALRCTVSGNALPIVNAVHE